MQKSIAVIMLAMLAVGSFSLIPSLASADTEIQRLSVRMRGIITQWGSDPVFGWLDAHAVKVNLNGTYREWAGAHAMWSYDRPRLNCSKPPTENVTFSFWAARLVKSSMIRFNYSGYDFYISGLWNVANITTSIYVNEIGEIINVTRVIEPWLTNATGELRVLPHLPYLPPSFELYIEGMPLLSGFVVMWRIVYIEIKICDVNNDDKVDLIDLVRVAKVYRAVPGVPHYIIEMDFDFNFRIDIGDLTTLAANIEG